MRKQVPPRPGLQLRFLWMSMQKNLLGVERPEFRSQHFVRLKRALKRVGIPKVLWLWQQTKPEGSVPTQ